MTLRVLFLGEGTSDSGIVSHIERHGLRRGIDVVVTDPAVERLGLKGDGTLRGKLQAVLRFGGDYDVIVIHRDADNQGRQCRVDEVRAAVRDAKPTAACVPVIPVRMTEAWLLVDERQIREVAGNPNGKKALGLPDAAKVEMVSDPKALLKDVLVRAADVTGRRREKFNQRFPQHRHQLLERIDPDGQICKVPSWNAFVQDLDAGLSEASSAK
ncbi:DUF4276 family protein [Sphaerisporangium sp. NPDC051011]|uniref:DUF4276 family protein n=1 Tax=Sphaerisporangium sp. NPDC051011 TaxID=3155792 RepID=UPI0033CD3F7D